MIHVCTITSPGVTFNTAKVTFKITGVKKDDLLYVFSKAGGKWDMADASVTADERVQVTISGNGPLVFFKRSVK